MDQLVLLVIIGLISLINWVMQKAAEKRERAKLERESKHEAGRNIYTQKPKREAIPRRAPSPQQDPLKELMEALGLPPDAASPPPAVPRAAPEFEEEFASLEESAPPLPRKMSVPRWQTPQVLRPDEKTARLASAFSAQEKSPAEKPRTSSVRAMLADRASKRHAIVIAEILGPPRAVQSLL